MSGINGTAIAVAAAGSVLAYSGLKNKSISNTLRYLIAGQNPGTSPDQYMYAGDTSTLSGGDAGTSTGSAPPTGGGTGNQYAHVIAVLKTHFSNKAAVAGIAGNMEIESGFSPTAFNAGEGAIGLCQWEGGRRAALQAYAKAHGLQETDVDAQLGYLMLELNTAFSPVRLQLMAVSDPGTAAALFDAQYEISSGAARQERIDAAKRIYASI